MYTFKVKKKKIIRAVKYQNRLIEWLDRILPRIGNISDM